MAKPKNISKRKVVQKQASERVKKTSHGAGFRTSTGSDGSVTMVRYGSKYDGGDKYSDQAVGKVLKNSGGSQPAIKGVQSHAADQKKKKKK